MPQPVRPPQFRLHTGFVIGLHLRTPSFGCCLKGGGPQMEISTPPPRPPPLPPRLNVCVFCWTNCLGAIVRVMASCQPGHRDYRFESTIGLTAADRRNPHGNWSSRPPDPCLPPPPPHPEPPLIQRGCASVSGIPVLIAEIGWRKDERRLQPLPLGQQWRPLFGQREATRSQMEPATRPPPYSPTPQTR